MTLLHFDGFELGDHLLDYAPSGTNQPQTAASTRFGYGRMLNTTLSGVSQLTKSITPSAEVFVGMAVSIVATTPGIPFITLLGDSGATSHLSVVWTNSTTLALQRGGTTIATASVNEPLNQWSYVELRATIADSGGRGVVKVDGATVIDFTGDTKNGGTSTNIDAVRFGKTASSGAPAGFYIDDFYICDALGAAPYNTFLGPIQVQTPAPSGAGSSTQMTPSTGANYAAVDEQPYSATDYVQGTSGQKDLYAMGDVASGTILAVQARGIAKATDAAPVSIKGLVKSGSTTNTGASTALGASDATVKGNILTTDPNTGAAWTLAGLNAIEAGFEVA